MKKFFYSMLLLAVAGMTTTSFVSCGDDNDESEQVEAKEDYFCFTYWLSNDVLELADVSTTGIGSLTFSKSVTYQGIDGKESTLVELSGNQAKNPKFTVKLTLKSNWREILANKDKCACYHNYSAGNVKGAATQGDTNMFGTAITRDRAGANFEEGVADYIENSLGLEY